MSLSLISRINQTTQLTPVILSGAPERFVSYQDHWRGVEGPRDRVLYHTVSGSSHENTIAARCGLGGFFLRDRSWPVPLGTFYSSHRKTKPKHLVGQGNGRTPYGGMLIDNPSGSFDCAPIIFVRRQPVVALRQSCPEVPAEGMTQARGHGIRTGEARGQEISLERTNANLCGGARLSRA